MWEEKKPHQIFRMNLTHGEKLSTLPMHDACVRAAAAIAANKHLSSIAEQVSAFRISTMAKPILSDKYLRGSIIYFDRFGNAVVNIQRSEFETIANGKRFSILFKRYSDVESMGENYSSVDESEKLCFFNSSGYLEIAINKGNARQLLNLSNGDTVQIEFH
jgi:S-adenosylmethionine hydrolase